MKSIILFIFFSAFIFSSFSWANKNPAKREIAVILTQEGYYPKTITVFEGERVRFFLTSTVEQPGCMIVQGHEVFLAAQKGKVSEVEVDFKTAGEFAFYCPSQRHLDGKLVVLKKATSSPSRSIATDENSPMLWTPKEYD